ncbi:MAG TPA: response regulator [Spirochaetia bacterium]|nr:response regulator [Spirochaetia bacterium]
MSALIYLVDDDRDFLDLLESILSRADYRVVAFSSPQSALAALDTAAELPSILITDLMMKSLDSGFSLAAAIRADPRLRAVRLIIVSAVASQRGFDFHPRSAQDLAAMHADAFFDKPVVPRALLDKVEELLR